MVLTSKQVKQDCMEQIKFITQHKLHTENIPVQKICTQCLQVVQVNIT